MNIEQKIKEIEGKAAMELDHTDIYIFGEREVAKQALEVINYLQSEVERYKSLYETNSAAEFKDEVIQLNKDGKYTIKFEGCFPKPPKQKH